MIVGTRQREAAMEAWMLSVMLAVCAESGLSVPNPPPDIAWARVYEADPLARYFLDADTGDRLPLAEALVAPPRAARVIAVNGAR
jgi:hypothetical protein